MRNSLKYFSLLLLIMLAIGLFPAKEYSNALTVTAAEIPCSHFWSDWETTKKATIFRTGTKERECYECGEVQKKTISKLNPFAKFPKKTYSLKVGKTLKLKVKYASGDKVKKWKSAKSSIVTVDSKGRLKGKKAGSTKVTVILKSGKKATCRVKVLAVKKTAAKSKSTKKAKSGSSRSSGGGTVYWTPGGSVYHKSRNCSTLKRSKVIKSGSISQSGKSRACKVCY
ncbi:MAG: Ig-like domain-containing protein [Eubacterium sp.]|nr:Ig-like domain-containing protein [Eubacterium sp.]